MKIHIFYNFTNNPFGGANQFLRALKEEFIKRDIYAESVQEAEVVLFNSHLLGGSGKLIFDSIYKIKNKYPQKVVLHRIDGPIYLHKQDKSIVDKFIHDINDLFVDGTIFQSLWSKEENYKSGFKKNKFEKIIYNAPGRLFFKKPDSKKDLKINLIASSWSSNWNKGFEIYKYLDKNLDFKKYNFTFIGNSPIEFENTIKIKPIPSMELAEKLKMSDIFITASKSEACSNSLIEAISCGLPSVVLNSGSNSELIKYGGEVFMGTQDVIEKIEKVSQNYDLYRSNLPQFSIKTVANEYYEFAETILNYTNANGTKQVSFNLKIKFILFKIKIFKWRAGLFLNRFFEKL